MNLAILNKATMSSTEIAELTGKQHKHVIVDVESLYEFYHSTYSAEKAAQLVEPSSYKDISGKSNKCYLLSKDAALDLITGYSLPHRHAVNQRWLELESNTKQALPNFSNPAEMAIEWARQYTIAQEAIATKAEIGCRREATSMNTASQSVKKSNALEIQLDKSKNYSTIKRMEMLTGIKFNWRVLKEASVNLEIANVDVFDANYSTVKSYHRDVWMEAFALDIDQ